MAPVRKPKAGRSKRLAADSELSPDIEVGIFKKPKQKKRKLSDKLGPQWSKRELERFYEGFRKYGHDWKKVANVVCNRSTEMVEALYNMNRAYLSLPEGTASVAGLIAMMTDHYSILDGSGSEKDSDGCSAKSPDVQRQLKELIRAGLSKELHPHSASFDPRDSCLSSLKKVRGCDGTQLSIPVKKRTLRMPVSAIDTISQCSPAEGTCGLRVYMNNNALFNAAAPALSEDQEKASCHKVSSPIDRVAKDIKHSMVSKGKKMLQNLKNRTDVASTEARLNSNGDEHADLAADLGKIHKDGKIRKTRNPDGMLETYNGVRERVIDPPGKSGVEALKFKIHISPRQAIKKENRKLLTEDENLAFDALQVLANMSLALPSATVCVESPKESANGGDITGASSALSDSTHVVDNIHSGKLKKKNRKTPALKNVKSECDSQSANQVKNEPFPEEDIKPGDVAKEPNQISVSTKQCKSARSSVVTSINNQQLTETDVAVSNSQVQATELVTHCIKRISRRKKRALISDEKWIPPTITVDMQGSRSNLKETLCCISSYMVRRWCGFEWFYSAIDYPWFAKKEFVEYLIHVGLGHIPRLTRNEWGVIRSSLGKPRRFSERFIHEEREKLQQYRKSVRSYYEQLRTGLREGLATDLARPLSVGQKVIAIHPKSREFHDGSILTVEHDKCRVQFDHPALGVEFVMDIDCMPWNMWENIPETLRKLECGNMRAQTMNGAPIRPFSQYMGKSHFWTGAPSLMQCVPDQAKVDLITRGSRSMVAANGCHNTSLSSLLIESCSGVQHADGDLQQRTLHPSHFLNRTCRFSLVNTTNCDKLIGSSAGINDTRHHSDLGEETGSKVAESVQDLRMKAHKMVDAAFEAMSSMKQGENTYSKIGEALESVGVVQIPPKAMFQLTTSQCPANGNSQNKASELSMENQIKNNASNGECEAGGFQLPSELITSCVATLLMIQDCTERQYPPAEVAHILDCAVTSLRPCCPQNLSVYREIQMCMGRIKTQILALIPS